MDFTWVHAGPEATRILADFGAEVIKIEHPQRPDTGREARPRGGIFNSWNRSKLGVTLNARHPKARPIIERLISVSDVVIESFSAHVLESWGLGYPSLVTMRPDIIYVSMAGFGHTGPWRDYQTNGPTVQALAGITYLAGMPGMPPSGWGYSYMDHTGGFFGAMAVLLALHHRNRTGRGQWVDLGQVEAGATLLETAILDYTVHGRTTEATGNRLKHPAAAPHGVYQCRGDDEWCAIAVFEEKEWQGLCEAIGNPTWTQDPKFTTVLGRMANQDELEQHIEEFTRNYTPREVMELLQQHGVRAGAVQSAQVVADYDPHIKERKLWVELQHPELGATRSDGIPIKLSATPGRGRRHAPLLGQDGDYVYREILGLTEDKVRELAAEKII